MVVEFSGVQVLLKLETKRFADFKCVIVNEHRELMGTRCFANLTF